MAKVLRAAMIAMVSAAAEHCGIASRGRPRRTDRDAEHGDVLIQKTAWMQKGRVGKEGSSTTQLMQTAQSNDASEALAAASEVVNRVRAGNQTPHLAKEDVAALRNITAELKTKVGENLKVVHSEDVAEWMSDYDAIWLCESERAPMLNSTSASLTAARQNHSACRQQEATLATSNASASSEFVALTASIPSPPATPSWSSNVQAMSMFFDPAANPQLNWYLTYYQSFQGKQGAAEAASASLAKQIVTCDGSQMSFEMAHCSHTQVVKEVCDCRSRAVEKYEHTKRRVEANTESRKLLHESLEKHICYGDVLLTHRGQDDNGTSDRLQACDELVANTSHLDMSPAAVPPKDCSGDLSRPCAEDWVSAEYGGFPSEVRMADCTPCSWELTTTTTTVAAAHYVVGGSAFAREDDIFTACPAGYVPAQLADHEDRVAIVSFIAGLGKPRGTMFLGNWFTGPSHGSSGARCAQAIEIGYLKGAGGTKAWAATQDQSYQDAFGKTWNHNANCANPPDQDGKHYDTPVMYVGPSNVVDLGNCKGGCGFPSPSTAPANFTASGAHSGNCFQNYGEGCADKIEVLCQSS